MDVVQSQPPPEALQKHCDEAIGPPRVEEVADGVFVAIGWDLANTTAIQVDGGVVVIDPGMSPARAQPVREALEAKTTGPVLAVIYTHSHIDHVGGAAVWVGEGTEVWATETLEPHFFAQYGTLLESERRRGARQFGHSVPEAALPCSALGRRVDIDAALEMGVVLPTHAFSGRQELAIGGRALELVEAHGETHDQLFVWLPDARVLFAGDNWYRAFPNLYTVRGTKPRPVDDWIESLDAMRAREPAVMVGSHTRPVVGADEVQAELRAYRDGIQWVRDAVVRGANEGKTVDQLAAEIGLPEHLADQPSLQPLYGELEWSVRAIYGNEVGWFDGRVDHLYPLPPVDRARRLVDGLGGPDAVLAMAERAASGGDDPRWGLELVGWLRDDGRTDAAELNPVEAAAAEALAATEANSNGRGYLLQSAHEARGGEAVQGEPTLPDSFVDRIPLDHVVGQLPARLKVGAAMGVHETVKLDFGEDGVFWITVRDGLCEVWSGDPLPGTPEPVATLKGDGADFRKLALQKVPWTEAPSLFEVEGPVALAAFFARFERGF